MTNVSEFVSILNKNGWSFYHFTDVRNLHSIKQQGLLSMAELRRRGIKVVTGGNQWSLDADAAKGMDRYVHLCFFDQHPMEYKAKQDGRIEKSRFLRVEPDVLQFDSALISIDVSNKANADYGDPAKYIDELDLEVIYKRTNWKDESIQARLAAARKCEILIPNGISTNYIRNL